MQAVTRAAGHDCDVRYLNLELAAVLGRELYAGLAEVSGERLHLVGEWVFSYAAFGEILPETDYYNEFPEIEQHWAKQTGQRLAALTELRRQRLPAWIEDVASESTWSRYDVIGFSSTFVQNAACLALGRRLRQHHPELVQAYGGANFDSEMGAEYAAKLPWLEHVVAGEADLAWPAVLTAIANNEPVDVPGVHVAGRVSGRDVQRVGELDRVPMPDYHDYFATVERLGRAHVLGDDPIKLLVEFARGCWWGQKHHCTFCGLNTLGMAFRPKSPARALAELTDLLTEYPVANVEVIDNILDMRYLSTFCRDLAERHWDINIFFEVKSNLDREQLAALRRAGAHLIQPGIESLSTRVLRLMRKGSTMLVNVRLLKWARYHGLSVAWNLLTGFPGETDADYRAQVGLMPLLHHLEPPGKCGRLWLERFSPYFSDPSFPISGIVPRSAYRHIYPADLDHSKIAYFFDHVADGVGSAEAQSELEQGVIAWQERWREHRPSLTYTRRPGELTLVDSRSDAPRRAELRGWEADAYEACGDAPRSAARVHATVIGAGHIVALADVETFLRRCCRSGVMLTDEGLYLSLALPVNPGW
jgi:ribosomal peptide maturation radical SAM protein 1